MAPQHDHPEPSSAVSPKHESTATGTRAGTTSPHSAPQSPGSNDDQQQQWEGNLVNRIEADSLQNPEDEDDGYESGSAATSTGSASLSSSINDYMFENNRRYHKFKEGRYLLPNDEVEQNREDMKHCMVMLLCDHVLHFAPLDNPQKVLDIGTGTGIWAIEMGDKYPSADVVGVDLSPIQSAWVPPNVRFYIDDIEADWVDADGSLDYVHLRHMGMAIKDWPAMLRQAHRAMKPGGWIEFQDLRLAVSCDDDTMPEDYGLAEFLVNLRNGFSAMGYDLLSLEKNRARLAEAGFTNIREMVWKVPVGVWPKDKLMKEVGMYNREVLAEALQGVSMGPYTRGLGWTSAEVEVFLTKVRKSLADSSVHSYYTFHVVYGQKPEN